jgi:hypothetical protein
MYTFQPLATIPVDHAGFFILCVLCVGVLLFCLFNEAELFYGLFFFVTLFLGFCYCVSYVWTDQSPKTFVNTPVNATLVGFQPEGYREKSGKSMVDRHYMYVVYKVNGEQVILQASPGVSYPSTAVLYKN